MNKNNFIGIDFLFNEKEIITAVEQSVKSGEVKYICAVNGNIASLCRHDNEYKSIINNSYFNLCDGSVLAKSYSLLYREDVESYPGPDFFIDTIKKKKYKSFFLGTSNEELAGLKKQLSEIDNNVQSMTFFSPPFAAVEDFDYPTIAKMINSSGADIIWVALGAPKQERFMSKLKPHLNKGVMVGVGAAFVFYSGGNIERAPEIIRRLKIEWLYRLFKDPKRILPRLRRQFRDLPILIVNEYLKIKRES